MPKPGTAALFLDRDGVINRDDGHVHRIADFVWVPGVFDTVRTANSLGFQVIVVTNQAGIAKGFYSEEQFHVLTRWMTNSFEENGAPIAGVYFCPEHPDSPPTNGMSCRKPSPGMLLRAAEERAIELHRSILIGDQETDIQAGRSAGLQQTALFASSGTKVTKADTVLATHAAACAWLLSLHRSTGS